MIPPFDEEGRLSPGVHETDLAEIEERMGWTNRRRALVAGLARVLELMKGCGVVRVYLDGSFVTDKDRPNDIDGCYDFSEEAADEDLERLAPIFPPSPANRAKAKELFGMDFFPAAAMELGSGQPFLRFFQRDREGHERGVLMVELYGARKEGE